MYAILVVDDCYVTMKMHSAVAGELCSHLKVFHFTDANDAIRELLKNNKKYEFKFAMIDIMMESMHGLLLAKKIREVNPNIAIIAVTGVDESLISPDNLDLFDLWLPKPLTVDKYKYIFDRYFYRPDCIFRNVCGEDPHSKLS